MPLDTRSVDVEMHELVQRRGATSDGYHDDDALAAIASSSSSAAVHTSSSTSSSVSLWRIRECDITTVKRLGSGAFGEVWEGVMQPGSRRVAIKVMRAGGAVDEEGDVIDPRADEDFRKECAALQRVDSPHLVKFFGFGTTESGTQFIVTELMVGGSLEEALHDRKRALQWRTRVAIGLQVALGMDHLHKRNMLHRDLKSANIVLGEQLQAKVCDFGLSRVARPRPRLRVVHSPFTGVTRLLPRLNDDSSSADAQREHNIAPLSTMADIAVMIEDAHGSMTRAAGTLLWMAPEVFRGDQNYGPAVDVYVVAPPPVVNSESVTLCSIVFRSVLLSSLVVHAAAPHSRLSSCCSHWTHSHPRV
jgi:serine/threonine protein kinase